MPGVALDHRRRLRQRRHRRDSADNGGIGRRATATDPPAV